MGEWYPQGWHQEKCTSLQVDINLLHFFYLFNALHQRYITFCLSKLMTLFDTLQYLSLFAKKKQKKRTKAKKKKGVQKQLQRS